MRSPLMSKSVGTQSWEEASFPVVCEMCLGTNPYMRMTKEPYGHDCKVCLKPFTNFRWCPGAKMRFRRTEICNTCARLKNVCQSCLFDLQYGLPVQVRDSVLGITESLPKNEANRNFFIASNAERIARGDSNLIDYDKSVDPAAKAILQELADKRKVTNKRMLANPCSFFAKGTCTRGEACPYRHVLMEARSSSLKGYRDRFYGENDPAALKLIERHPHLAAGGASAAGASEAPPADQKVVSLFVRGIRNNVGEDDISRFFADHGAVKSVRMVADGKAAVVAFADRAAAEEAATKTVGLVDINGTSVHVSWSKPKSAADPSKGRPHSSARGQGTASASSTGGSAGARPEAKRPADAPASGAKHNAFQKRTRPSAK